jgi:hypothetical protein
LLVVVVVVVDDTLESVVRSDCIDFLLEWNEEEEGCCSGISRIFFWSTDSVVVGTSV